MAVKANTTRRFALLGALVSTAALAVPVVKAEQARNQTVDLESLSHKALATILLDVFDHATFTQQVEAISSIRAADMEQLADILDRRHAAQWEWKPTHIPGLSVPSNA